MSENRLGLETSPYLLQHKDNPVHWWAWGPEALAEAKRTGKPILLSVGYAACHWCHVMAHESFEDQPTAAVMNDLYINIKVDREERPDIDALYMSALMRFNEQGGWPLTMFLDSHARPFWGGTYFPKQSQYGRPAFVNVLLQIAEVFQNEPGKVEANAGRIMLALQERPDPGDGRTLSDLAVKDLTSRLAAAVDKQRGGLNGAPKFPQWNVFWLLWRAAMRFNDDACKQAVITTLANICQGGIYDHVGGGFSRYSVDEDWLVPHFEKMLYDNALLIDLMTEVWRETQDPLLLHRVRETVGWLEREMIAEGGGFAASLDADSEGEEGKFYVWTPAEIEQVLGRDDATFFAGVYGVTDDGNFEGHTILNRLDSPALLSEPDEVRLSQMRCKLFGHRAKRVRPGWDDKVLADWNGLMIAALSRAAIVFEKPEWLAMSERAFACVSKHMAAPGGRLWHSLRAGKTKAPATASDYANMTWAALRLHQATGTADYLDHAKSWTKILDAHYWDTKSGGYCTAADDTSDVVARMRPAHDDAVPSANAIQLSNLMALWALTGDATYEKRARGLYNSFQLELARAPIGHCGLIAAGFDFAHLVQIVVSGPNTPATAALQRTVYSRSVPGALEYYVRGNSLGPLPVALGSKPGALDKSTAYICSGTVCGLPEHEPDALTQRLIDIRSSR